MKNILDLIKYVSNTDKAALFIGNLVQADSKIYFYTAKDPIKLPIVETQELNIYEKFKKKGYWGYIKLDYEFAYKVYNIEDNIDHDSYFVFDKPINWEVFSVEQIDLTSIYQDYLVNINYLNNIDKDKYIKKLQKIKSKIAEGYTYQLNYTEKLRFRYDGKVENLIMNLLFNQSTNYIAIINNSGEIIISLSPELFFQIEDGKIKSSPMKGTIKRGYSLETDEEKKIKLSKSKKNKAENIIIVDLIRNDLNRICKSKTVEVEELFKIEKYETVYQMISTVKGELCEDITFCKVIESLFPCGSVTGAPKAKTISLIKEFEETKRGIYTGAIGILTNKKQIFNIPIRTLVIDTKINSGEFGIGSGIIYTSNPSEEYKEVLLKGKFIDNIKKFYLIETIRLENGEYVYLEEHLSRLEKTSEFFIFRFDKDSIFNKLFEISQNYKLGKYKVRLRLYKYGHIEIDLFDIKDTQDEFKVVLYPKRIYTQSFEFNFKTSLRKTYNEGYEYAKSKGYDEVIFMNHRGEITEGSFTNIFYKKNDYWYTPSKKSGLLNGIYRQYLLNKGAKEKITTIDELTNAQEIILTNSVRGEMKARLFLEHKF